MNKFGIGIAVVTVLIVIGGVFFFTQKEEDTTPLPTPTTYEYYWGDGCPHCKKVAEFFDTTDKDEKANIDKKEVWNNPANAAMMQKRAKACNIAPTEMGVPFLVKPDGTCIGGDDPIIDFFKNLEI